MAEEYRPGSFVLDADSLTGTVSKMSITTDQKLIFEDTVEIDALGEQNQTLRNEISRNEKVPDGMVKVASLPMMVYLDLQKRGILGDRSALRRWLKTEEARPYRTHWMTS